MHYHSIQFLASRILRSIGNLLVAFLFLASYALGQQSYVGRWDAYGGFMRLMQPSINLAEPGFNLQVGTVGTGQNILEPGMLVLLAEATQHAAKRAGSHGFGPGRLQAGYPGRC
jgi:hypothetical protein